MEEDIPGKYSFFSTSQRCSLTKRSCGSPVLARKLLAKEVQYSRVLCVHATETPSKWPDSDTINPFRIMVDPQQGVGVYFANSVPNTAETRHRRARENLSEKSMVTENLQIKGAVFCLFLITYH